MPAPRPIRRWAGPASSLVLLTLLSLITASLPYSQAMGGYSVAGAWLHAHVLPMRRNLTRPGSLDLYFIREEGAIRVADLDAESAGEVAAMLSDPRRRERVLHIQYRPESRRWGWWAITRQQDKHALVLNFGEGFTPEQREFARREFLARARRDLAWVPPETLDRLARGEMFESSRVLLAGWVVNALTLGLLVWFLVSLRWVRDAPGWWRQWRRGHALAAGRCPGCGYSILSLKTSVCPECGRAFG